MNKITAWLNNIRLDRILTVFVLSLVLLVTTACNSGSKVLANTADQVKDAAKGTVTADQVRKEVPEGAVTSPKVGGMNEYPDVDPRANTSAAEAKAKALVENAQKNIDKKSLQNNPDSSEQYVENYKSGTPLGERVERLGEDISESAKDVGEDVAKGTQENVKNITETAQDAAGRAKESAAKTGDAAQAKVKSDVATTQQAIGDAADAVKSKVSKDVSRTQAALDNAADAVD